MSKVSVAEISFDESTALWLTDYLLSQPADKPPFNWPDPALLLVQSLHEMGWQVTGDQETLARLLFGQTILDAGVDSYVLTGSILEHLSERPWLIDPEYFESDWENALKEASYWVHTLLGHFYRSALAQQYPISFLQIGRFFSSQVLNVIKSNGHPVSATATLETLLASEAEWKAQANLPSLDLESGNPSLFPGIGPKKARLFLLRLAKAGVCEFPDIHKIGIPPDVHAVVLSFCLGIIKFAEPVGRDRAVRYLRDFWTELCEKHQLNNVELYWRLWLWGRRFCRPVNCSVCPLRHLVATAGRLSTGGYYSKRSTRWLDPGLIVSDMTQYQFQMGDDFWPTYAPEAKAAGLRITEGVAEFARRKVSPDLQLTIDVEPVAAPRENSSDEDPFED